jgi:hypothetical protein
VLNIDRGSNGACPWAGSNFPISPIALGITRKARKLRLYGSSWSDVLNAPIQSGHLTSMNIPPTKGESYYANSLRARGISDIRVIAKVTESMAENAQF